MKKEGFRHYVLAFVSLFILITSILILVFKISIVGFVMYAANEACMATTTDNSGFSDTQTCNLDPNFNGPTITTNNVVLNWNL